MLQLLILSSSLLLAAGVTAETCPGGRVRCPDFMTCCQLSSDKQFGCCPFPEAKCCADHVHCCPHSMDCDIAHQSCIRNGTSVKSKWYVPVNAEIVEPVLPKLKVEDTQEGNSVRPFSAGANECPDKTACHSTFTCCKMFSGSYGCCPFDNGTCCNDGFHCCPNGLKCTPSGGCYSVEMDFEVNAYPLRDEMKKHFKTKSVFRKPHHQQVSDPGGVCPDGHPCPEKYTCCKISGKRYGCCPYTDAICCDDGIHCCPKGTNCNSTLGTCDVQRTFQWSFPSQPLEALQWREASTIDNKLQVSDIVCPDEEYHCPSHTTCCVLEGGAYGCCPLERATCCEDKKHCCPYSFQCTVGGCVRGTVRLPSFIWNTPAEKTPTVVQHEHESLKTTANVSSVICPDDYPCPDGNTCCQLESGDYGCCPMEKATCCADKVHCCPHGYRCADSGCKKESEDFLYPLTINSTKLQRDSEVDDTETEETRKGMPELDLHEMCPDQSECPDGSTCCEVAEGGYGCCAYEDATCCGDKIHCCPHGYWCSDEGCDRMPGVIEHYAPFMLKLFSTKKTQEV